MDNPSTLEGAPFRRLIADMARLVLDSFGARADGRKWRD